MKKTGRFFTLLIIVQLSCSWGFFAHKKINRLAVFTLPTGMARFYKNNLNFITEHAVDPDKRRYTDSAEATRHFLDADHYGVSPFDSIPQKWEDAEKKYGAKILNSYGTVPWQIQKTYRSLVRAFSDRDSLKILRLSAELGHYIADAHVPLHSTENYNGLLTGQAGIHAFWESRLPELFGDEYDYYTGKPGYTSDPLTAAWKIIAHTFSLKDSVLLIEKGLDRTFPAGRKYTFAEHNGKVERQYSEEYSRAYHTRLNGMVEAQLRSSIADVASFWLSAWIDAGKPSLQNLPKKQPTDEERKEAENEEKGYAEGKSIGREI